MSARKCRKRNCLRLSYGFNDAQCLFVNIKSNLKAVATTLEATETASYSEKAAVSGVLNQIQIIETQIAMAEFPEVVE